MFIRQKTLVVLLALLFLIGCASTAGEEEVVSITVSADGTTKSYSVPLYLTVNDVLREVGIPYSTDSLDRVNPPGITRVEEGMTITVRRVQVETVIDQVEVPFSRRTTSNNNLPAGETRLLQPGVNGLAEITYRITYEDGVEVSRTEIRRDLIEPPVDEVVMTGSRSELQPVTVSGSLLYISGGNAWIIRQNSANRRPLTSEGGLDARVFTVNSETEALLFTRTTVITEDEITPSEDSTPETDSEDVTQEPPTPESEAPNEADQSGGPFNKLWVIQDTSNPNATAIPLALDNILWADWVPDSLSLIVYSTAEPRSGFPGWQANNDLWIAQIGESGEIIREQQLLEASGGGIYGWYGTFFNFAPDGRTLVWRQPDAVGLLQEIFPAATDEATPTPTVSASLVEELEEHRLFSLEGFSRTPEIQFAPRNAYDFVWIPDASWSPDGEFVVTTTHGPPLGAESAEDSPVYNLTIFPRDGAYQIELISNVGMWALPAFSPIPDPVTGDIRLAYLQAEDPLNSVVSSYRLIIRDIDGSNARTLFPEEDDLGLTANLFAWSPDGLQIAVTYQGNIYIIDTLNGLAQQVTGDGQSSIPRWVP